MIGYIIAAFVGFIGGVVFGVVFCCFYDVTIEEEEEQ